MMNSQDPGIGNVAKWKTMQQSNEKSFIGKKMFILKQFVLHSEFKK